MAARRLADKGVAIVTKADNAQYLAEDMDLFTWNMSAAGESCVCVCVCECVCVCVTKCVVWLG
jgi:hypothetical protein